jgi:hypothetical protein
MKSMGKLIKRSALTGIMGFSWDLIKTGERGIERCEAVGITDLAKPYAGFRETMAWWKGWAMVRTGERLEHGVNWFAMRLGYDDGEVSAMVVRKHGANHLLTLTPSIVEPLS